MAGDFLRERRMCKDKGMWFLKRIVGDFRY